MVSDLSREQFRDVAFTTATPFGPDGEVAHDSLAGNLKRLADAGAGLFIPCGNTGEFYALTPEERAAVVETHVEALPADATVVAGVAGSTRSVVKRVERYAALGVDAVMVMHPDHTYAHERGLATYYERIADAAEVGVVVYKRSHDVSARVLDTVTRHENVVAVKYAVDDVAAFGAAVERMGDRAAWLNGIAERYALPFAVAGADGFTTGIGNFLPGPVLALRDAIAADDRERARDLVALLRPIEELRQEAGADNDIGAANNVPVVKHGMDLAGFEGGTVREPLVELSEGDRERVEECYERVRAATE
jgi:4-hydroxy-tetrahydrodipicolinate synthase